MNLLKTIHENPKNVLMFIEEQANLTVKKSFESQSIRVLENEGEDLFTLLNSLLYATALSLNVSNNLNEFQAYDIIKTIIGDYKDIKFDELVYLFKQGKKGIYGPHYNKFDIETIIFWINSYYASNEYNDFLENRHKQPIEKVELTQEQKDNWAKINETLSNLGKKNIDENLKEYGLHKFIETLNEQQLMQYQLEFQVTGYQEGATLIQNELKRRQNG